MPAVTPRAATAAIAAIAVLLMTPNADCENSAIRELIETLNDYHSKHLECIPAAPLRFPHDLAISWEHDAAKKARELLVYLENQGLVSHQDGMVEKPEIFEISSLLGKPVIEKEKEMEPSVRWLLTKHGSGFFSNGRFCYGQRYVDEILSVSDLALFRDKLRQYVTVDYSYVVGDVSDWAKTDEAARLLPSISEAQDLAGGMLANRAVVLYAADGRSPAVYTSKRLPSRARSAGEGHGSTNRARDPLFASVSQVPVHLLSRVLLLVHELYVYPDEIMPTEMAQFSLEEIDSQVPEIEVGISDWPRHISIQVAGQEKDFWASDYGPIAKLWNLKRLVQGIIGYTQQVVADGDSSWLSSVSLAIEYAAIDGILLALDGRSRLVRPAHQEAKQPLEPKEDAKPRPPITHSLVGGGVGYMRIANFSAGTSRKLNKSLRSLEKKNTTRLQGLIIDLRGCAGGSAGGGSWQADSGTGLFVSRSIGSISTPGPKGGSRPFSIRREDRYPIVILTDSSTRGAAIFFASNLRGAQRAIMLREGNDEGSLVLEDYEFKDGSTLKLAVAEFLPDIHFNDAALSGRDAAHSHSAGQSGEDTAVKFARRLLALADSAEAADFLIRTSSLVTADSRARFRVHK